MTVIMEWTDYLNLVLEWVSSQNVILVWIFFFFSNLLENVFPPWPGDTVTVFGGFLIAQTGFAQNSSFGFWSLATSTLLGNFAGAFIMYRFGHRFLNFIRHKNFPFKDELYSEEKIESTFKWFRKNSVLVVVLSRFSAGIRFFVSIVAGMVHMNLGLFFFLFGIAVFLWCGLLIWGGYSLGQNWDRVLEYLHLYNRLVGILIISIIALLILKNFFGKKKPEQ